ncbi:MAG: cytidine deaminase [Oscillospiraceae bacterium]|nr:cytidine deaminase [Oscillospiraceae bacterium]
MHPKGVTDMEYKELLDIAKTARKNAYAPYSKFYVGTALLTKSGKVYTGCNVENLSFGATICAERCAIAKAVSEGERDFSAIAVYAGEKFTSPCGICLQTIYEFTKDIDIVLADRNAIKVYKLQDLMPISAIPIE